MSAAQLKHRVKLKRPASGFDALGQPADGFELVATVWGDIRLPNGLAIVKADADVSQVKASIRIRMRRDVQPGWCAEYRGLDYLIDAVLPDEQALASVDLVCRLVT